MLFDARAHVNITVEVLGLKPQPDLKRWFEDRWDTFGPPLGGALGEDARTKLMRGKYHWQDSHFRVLHRVLCLDEFGLTPEETWNLTLGNHPIPTPDEFRALLTEVRSEHVDPLFLIKTNSDPRLTFEVRPAHARLAIDGAEPYLNSSDGRPIVPAASPICFTAVPRVDGYFWVLSRHSEERTSILNEHLGHPRGEVYPADKLLPFPARNSASVPGDRDLVAINWSKEIDLRDYDLSSLLERNDVAISDSELRRLGVAVADSAQSADETKKIWASVLPIQISA